jgi:hypothetical protein
MSLLDWNRWAGRPLALSSMPRAEKCWLVCPKTRSSSQLKKPRLINAVSHNLSSRFAFFFLTAITVTTKRVIFCEEIVGRAREAELFNRITSKKPTTRPAIQRAHSNLSQQNISCRCGCDKTRRDEERRQTSFECASCRDSLSSLENREAVLSAVHTVAEEFGIEWRKQQCRLHGGLRALCWAVN